MGYRREVQPLPKIGPFQARLDALLEEDEARPRRDKLGITRIHDLLLRDGFDGSYDAVRRYAARWRQARRRDVMNAPAFIPLLFRPGEAYQFDWSHEDVEIAGKPMRVKVAHVRLTDGSCGCWQRCSTMAWRRWKPPSARRCWPALPATTSSSTPWPAGVNRQDR